MSNKYSNSLSIIRENILNRTKMSREDYQLVLRRLELDIVKKEEQLEINKNMEEFIDTKINYFIHKGNREKVKEYEKVKKLWKNIFECFLKGK